MTFQIKTEKEKLLRCVLICWGNTSKKNTFVECCVRKDTRKNTFWDFDFCRVVLIDQLCNY